MVSDSRSVSNPDTGATMAKAMADLATVTSLETGTALFYRSKSNLMARSALARRADRVQLVNSDERRGR